MIQGTYEEREKEFLKKLTALTHKYGIYIWGCGCCGSPALVDGTKKRSNDSKNFKDRSYTYKDELQFE